MVLARKPMTVKDTFILRHIFGHTMSKLFLGYVPQNTVPPFPESTLRRPGAAGISSAPSRLLNSYILCNKNLKLSF